MSSGNDPVMVGLGYAVFGSIIASFVFQTWEPILILLCCIFVIAFFAILFKGSG